MLLNTRFKQMQGYAIISVFCTVWKKDDGLNTQFMDLHIVLSDSLTTSTVWISFQSFVRKENSSPKEQVVPFKPFIIFHR
jgi:hypothetical protein